MNIENLKSQIDNAKKEFVTDGYPMSIGELVGLYKEGELIVNPNFQIKFRKRNQLTFLLIVQLEPLI